MECGIFAIIAENVTVEEGAVVEYSLVMPGSVIKKGALVRYAIVAENVVVDEGATIGERPEDVTDLTKWGVSVVGAGLYVGKNAKISAGVMIRENVKDGDKQ